MHFLSDQVNTGQADGTPGLDLNVAEAWGLGFTGKGVTIAIMDDGMYFMMFRKTHLSHNELLPTGISKDY